MWPKSGMGNHEFHWIYFQEYEWGVAYRRRSNSKATASPKHTPAWVTLEHTAQPTGSSAGWRVFFLVASIGRNLYQSAWLVSSSSRSGLWVFFTLGLPETDSVSIAYSGGEGPGESGQFQELPAAILRCLLSCLKIFHAGLQDDRLFQFQRTLLHNSTIIYIDCMVRTIEMESAFYPMTSIFRGGVTCNISMT